MTQYKATELLGKLYSIDEGMVRCFFIIGDDHALLVDTGASGGPLKQFCRTLTDLPIEVVATHADGDHTSAFGQFSKIFMHEAELGYYAAKGGDASKVLPVRDGDVFRCGAYQLEAVHIPGHTPGSIALIERAHRFLISGDSVSLNPVFMFGEGRSFPDYIASMEKLCGLLGEFDTVFASHGPVELDPSLIPELLEGARAFVAGKLKGRKPTLPRPMPALLYPYGDVSFFGPKEE